MALVDTQQLTPEQLSILEGEKALMSLTQEQKDILQGEEKRIKAEPVKERDTGLFGKYNPLSVPNMSGALVEPAMVMGSAALGAAKGGYDAINQALINKLNKYGVDAGDIKGGEEVVGNALERYTYKPKTMSGGIVSNMIAKPFQKYAEGAKYAGDKSQDTIGRNFSETQGKLYGAATEGMLHLAPMLLGAKAAPKGRMTPPPLRKPVDFVKSKAHGAGQTVTDALTTRFSKNSMDDMIGRLGVELAGDRAPQVVSALKDAKDVTAAQAAVPASSYEFSALQKMGKDRNPSGYGALERSQSLGRRQAIKDNLAKTPEQLKLAEDALAAESAKAYGKSNNQIVDPRSAKQKLVETAIKSQQMAKSAENAKGYALQDKGRFDTLEANQGSRAMGNPPVVDAMLTKLSGKKTPTNRDMGFIEGEVRPPARYTPQRQVEMQAGNAATEVGNVAKLRALQEKTHTSISESMLLNTKGEKGLALSDFSSLPSIKQAIKKAKSAAKETRGYWPKNANEPYTVANLQRIKREVADTIAADVAQGRMGKTTKGERSKTVAEFTAWLRKESPEFAKAEDMFAEKIQPINQMKFGQEVLKKTDDRLLDVTDRPREHIKIMDDASKLTKDITGRNIPLKDFLTENQMKTMENVKGQYIRDAELKKMSSGGLKKLNEVIGTAFDLPTVSILERTMVIINSVVKRLEGRNTRAALDRFADLNLNNPQKLGQLMKAATKEEAAFLNKHANTKTKATLALMASGAQQETGE